jgi:hypothetical protein
MRDSAALMVFKRMAWLVNMRRLADACTVHVHEDGQGCMLSQLTRANCCISCA